MLAPVTRENLGRSRCIRSAEPPSRWPRGFKDRKLKPPPPPPRPPLTKPTTVCTDVSRPMMFTKRVNRCLEIWNELDWSACIPPLSRPVSWVGKKPLGTMVNR